MSQKSSIIFALALALPLLGVGSANAVTIGLSCPGNVQLIIAPTADQAETCAMAQEQCSEGFRVNGGHFAIAQSLNGLAHGVSAGYRSAQSATEKALAQCESKGDGACAIQSAGNDDAETVLNCPYAIMEVEAAAAG